MPAYLLGMNAGLYQGAEGEDDPTAMTLITAAMDVTVNLTANETDVTTRGNNGWDATATTTKAGSIDFKLMWQPGDAVFDAIRAAYLASAPLSFAALDQLVAVVGADGPVADYSITSFTRNEPLKDALTVDVSLKIALYHTWHTTV